MNHSIFCYFYVAPLPTHIFKNLTITHNFNVIMTLVLKKWYVLIPILFVGVWIVSSPSLYTGSVALGVAFSTPFLGTFSHIAEKKLQIHLRLNNERVGRVQLCIQIVSGGDTVH